MWRDINKIIIIIIIINTRKIEANYDIHKNIILNCWYYSNTSCLWVAV